MGYEKYKRPLLVPGVTESPTSANLLGGLHSSEMNQGLIQSTVVSLTAANLIAMFTTPVSLLPAPGAGYASLVDQIAFEMNASSTAFTGGGGVNFIYHGTSTAVAGLMGSAVVTAGPGTTLTLLTPIQSGITVPANTGLDVTNISSAFATGTGSARIHLRYRVVTL